MADEGLGWWSALKWAWSNKAEIVGSLARVREWFKSDPGRGILIIGAGGVGKTTLAAILGGSFDWLTSDPWEYNESYGIEYSSLADNPRVGLIVPPGQTGRRDALWRDVESKLASGGYRGVIVVGANGYHTLRDSYKTHTRYKGNKAEFLTAYLTACREDEIAILTRVAAALRTAPTKTWLLSVVTKEDLWWSDRDEAEEFYARGAYAEVLADIAAVVGIAQFRHELVRTALVINNFQSGEGEPLVKNVAGYDHRQQVESVRRLFEALNALREWEEAK